MPLVMTQAQHENYEERAGILQYDVDYSLGGERQ